MDEQQKVMNELISLRDERRELKKQQKEHRAKLLSAISKAINLGLTNRKIAGLYGIEDSQINRYKKEL